MREQDQNPKRHRRHSLIRSIEWFKPLADPPHTATTLPPTKVQLVTLSSNYGMVLLGVTLGFVCRSDCHLSQDRRRGREFESGDRYPHERHSGFQLGIAIFTTTGASIA